MLKVGESYILEYSFTPERVRMFAEVTGDDNPLHIDPVFVEGSRFEKNIVHGMFLVSLISRVLGRHFPGEGTIYVKQAISFLDPVYVDETVSITVTILEFLEKGRARVDTCITKADGTKVLTGEALIIVPHRR
jgi:3-hydroxybutyryl-CoA dehydratase